MANLIQIKRSLTTATAPSLANGELAFTANGDHLFIGSNGASITIAGKFNPGVLTANQALVANGTGFIDAVKTANLTTQSITANGVSSPGAGYLLAVDAGGNTFWQPAGAVSINAAAQYNWTNTHTFNANVTLATTAGLIANGGIGTAGQVLHSNGSSVYWAADDGITTVTAGDGLTGGGTSASVTLNVVAANGITVSADAVAVTAANGISVTASGVNVLAGDGLISNATGVHVVAGNGISVSADALAVNPGSTLTVNTTGVHVNSALSITDLTLSGNLTVQGTLTTVDTTNLVVKDPMIELANGNVSTDALDIGFYGQYGSTGAKFTGLFRDATDGIYKLYSGLTLEPTTTVDISNTSYTQATLQAFLNSAGLVANSTAVTITANSTYNVNLTANSLSLSTPLAVTSGGIGRASITAGAILVGNGAGATTVLAAGTDGYVLQSNGTSVVYGTLDGGTF
jgi:hypothetical protein